MKVRLFMMVNTRHVERCGLNVSYKYPTELKVEM